MSGGQQSDSASGTLGVSGAVAVTGSVATSAQGNLTYTGDEGYPLTGEAMTMSGGTLGPGTTIDLPT